MRETAAVTPEWNDAWTRIARHYPALVQRDARWLDYRFRGAPGRRYRLLMVERNGTIAGLLVTRTPPLAAPGALSTDTAAAERRVGWIADILTEPGDSDAADALLDAAVRMLREHETDEVRALAMPGTWIDRRLARAGFFRSHGRYPICIVPLAVPTVADIPASDWFFTGGDFDVV